MKDVLVAIPAYQGEATVADVVTRARAATGLPVLVVDDGSTDATGARAEAAGATVLRHAANRGKGAALQTAFAYADRQGYRAVLTLDADGQHDPGEAPLLVNAHHRDPSALVIGVRQFDPALMPGRSRFGNKFSTWWISLFARRPHKDTQSGFRVYPRALFAGAKLRTTRFDTETELVLLAAKKSLPLVEVPVRTIYFGEKPRTHFRWTDSMRILRLVVTSPTWRV